MMMGYGTIGAFVASRVPGNPLGWLMLVVGVSFGVTGLSRGVRGVGRAHRRAVRLLWPHGSPTGRTWSSFSPLLLILLLFPTGRVPSPRWRFVPYMIVGAAVALAIVRGSRPGSGRRGRRGRQPHGRRGARAGCRRPVDRRIARVARSSVRIGCGGRRPLSNLGRNGTAADPCARLHGGVSAVLVVAAIGATTWEAPPWRTTR